MMQFARMGRGLAARPSEVAARRGRSLALAAGLCALALAGGRAQAQQRAEPLRYVLVGESGAKLRNIGDPKGIELSTLERDTPLAVHEERAGWLRVEVPGGYRAWVYGQYLTASGAGWYVVNGNSVNLRPLPESTNQSFPVDRVHSGDRVRMIERKDPATPLEKDWVRVWSPPGTTAWVLGSQTRALPEGSDGQAMWSTALDGALAARAASRSGTPAEAAAPAAPAAKPAGDAVAALREAERLLEGLPEGATQEDLAPVRAAFEAVLAQSPDPATEQQAKTRLELIGLREELARIRAGLAENRQRGEERKKEIESELAELERRKDPLMGRFEVRGWVIKEKGQSGAPLYLVRWAGGTQAQLVCTSGRYDLESFVNNEVGVLGFSAPQSSGPATTRVDVRKLEVISSRPAGLR